jgi:uncharacterized protein
MFTVLVLAKEPLPGRVKTRLTPEFTPAAAAALAAAAIADTLTAVAQADVTRRVLVLDGQPGPWLPPSFVSGNFEVWPQVKGGLADRLAGAFAAVSGPCFLVGMDTPQLTPADFEMNLSDPDRAAIGLCPDGGFWGIGFGQPRPQVFAGVPMSTESTGAIQRDRLVAADLRVRDLPVLRDVDTAADAAAVAALAPQSRFAAAWHDLRPKLVTL